VRQIKQEGAPAPAGASMQRKDTITALEWFRAMDDEADKEREAYATLRNTMRANLRYTKSSRRVNENFEDFMRQAQAAEEQKAPVKSKSMSTVHNSPPPQPKNLPVGKSSRELTSGTKTVKKAPWMEPPKVEETPKVEDKKNVVIMNKELAPDDESLKVFLQVWNQLDTLEEHLAVQEELAEAEQEKLQLAKEDPTKPQTPRGDAKPATPRGAETKPLTPRDAETKPLTPRAESLVTTAPGTKPVDATPSTSTPATSTPSPSTPEPAIPEPTKPEPTQPEPTTAEPTKPTPELEPTQQALVPSLALPAKAPSPTTSPRDAATPRSAIPSHYKGPHYKAGTPVTREFVEALLQYCADEGLSAYVPYAYVKQVILDAMEVFRAEPTILDIPLDNKVAVVGDIHGQFPDLVTILRDTGLPVNGQSTLVFNGDFVDRGPAGVEVLLSLYIMKLCWPKNIFIHRGNHELESINRKYNFADQVIKKYDEDLFGLIQDSFALLPLGGVIANKVLVIHGGLPDEPVSLGQLRLLPKVREDPTKATTGPEKLIQGILWSDPRDRRGTKASKRGAGVEFGPDVTAAFMARSNLDLIVRSHEMVEEGFQLTHDGCVMTIFSASYYCGVSTNKGAFAVFTAGSDLKTPTIVQYYAQAYSARDNVLKNCVKDTIEKLREMIFVNRHRLCLEFSTRDKKGSGRISKEDWSESMSSVMGLHIGWHGMLPYLAKIESDDRIVFIKFLDRYKITPKISDELDEDEEDERDKQEDKIKEWQKETMGYMCANMHASVGTTLDDAFTKFDTDKDGKLSYKEFMDAITTLKLNRAPPEDNYYYDMLRRMDLDEDGQISKNDWEESLKPMFDRVRTLHVEQWIPAALVDMRAALEKNFDFITNPKSRVKSAFRKCRAEGGKVQRRGFSDWIEKTLEMEDFSSVQKMRLALYVDFNGNGKISWREFKKVFWKPEYYSTIQENLFKSPSNG
jgi:Ca2+-binding EF-hand superfamily protein